MSLVRKRARQRERERAATVRTAHSRGGRRQTRRSRRFYLSQRSDTFGLRVHLAFVRAADCTGRTNCLSTGRQSCIFIPIVSPDESASPRPSSSLFGVRPAGRGSSALRNTRTSPTMSKLDNHNNRNSYNNDNDTIIIISGGGGGSSSRKPRAATLGVCLGERAVAQLSAASSSR